MLPCQTTNSGTFATSATIGCENASADPGTAGHDATDRGAANAAFPPCDLRLLPESVVPVTVAGTSALEIQEPFCSIDGVTGTVQLPVPCVNPCYDDDNSSSLSGVEILLPWKLNLFGRPFRYVVMNANGVLFVADGSPGASSVNIALPGTTNPENVIAPFWDDLEGTAASKLLYRVDGLPGGRVMTFEWKAFGKFTGTRGDCTNAGGNISTQVKLFEGGAGSLMASSPPCPYETVVPGIGNDRLEFHYDHGAFAPPAAPAVFNATIGAENWKGTIGNTCVAGTANAAPPLIGGAGAKCVISTCDTGTIRFFGDANNNGQPGARIPEIKTNGAAPVNGNLTSLDIVGASPGSDAYLLLQLGGAIQPTSIPVPCGGLPLNLGALGSITLWLDVTSPGFLLVGPLPTSNSGCVHLDLPIMAGLSGFTVYAQWVAILTVAGAIQAIEVTEGLRIVFG
jgi:hypothetical protein